MSYIKQRPVNAVMVAYRSPAIFTLFIHLLYACQLWLNVTSLFSLQINVRMCTNISLIIEHPRKRVLIGKNIYTDIRFLKMLLNCFLCVVLCCWISIVLMRLGDINPNPGPTSSDQSVDTDASSSTSIWHSSSASHISFVHYNIQSLMHKIDLLYSGLRDFDIIGFTETWLNSSISSTDLLFDGFHQPIRKDRPSDSHGGVAIYVNESIVFKSDMISK